jgi:hypothetical protein
MAKQSKPKAATAEFCASLNFEPMSAEDLERIKPPRDLADWANANKHVFLSLHIGAKLMGTSKEEMIAKFEADPHAGCDLLEMLGETVDYFRANADFLDTCLARYMVASSVVELRLTGAEQ